VVSQRFVSHTEHKLSESQSRNLAGVPWPVLMLDGVHFGQHVVLVALGIDLDGNTCVLGL